jgi:hypothetical protein
MLCDGCATELFGDPQRYHWALTEAGRERKWALLDALGEADPAPPCDRCQGPIFEV